MDFGDFHQRERRLRAEISNIAKAGYLSLESEFNHVYIRISHTEINGSTVNPLDAIEEFIQEKYDIPFSLSKFFDFHNESLFQSKPIDFGFTAVNQFPTSFENQVVTSERYNRVNFTLMRSCSSGLSGISSKVIKEKLSDEDTWFEFEKLCIEAHLRRFFLYGKIEKRWIILDYLVKHGIYKYPNCLHEEYNQLAYSIDFFERFGEMGIEESTGRAWSATERYNLEKQFFNKIRNRPTSEFTYSDVIEEFLIRNPELIEYKNGVCITSNKLGRFCAIPFDNYLPVLNWCTPMNLQFSIDLDDLFPDETRTKILETYSAPENTLRTSFGLPKIGEGWISETNLYYQIKEHFSGHFVVQHAKPKWLGRQHLDIWFPKENIAIEYQGDQHFYPVEFFGGEQSLEKTKARDMTKQKLCKENGCELIYVLPDYQIDDTLGRIRELL